MFPKEDNLSLTQRAALEALSAESGTTKRDAVHSQRAWNPPCAKVQVMWLRTVLDSDGAAGTKGCARSMDFTILGQRKLGAHLSRKARSPISASGVVWPSAGARLPVKSPSTFDISSIRAMAWIRNSTRARFGRPFPRDRAQTAMPHPHQRHNGKARRANHPQNFTCGLSTSSRSSDLPQECARHGQ